MTILLYGCETWLLRVEHQRCLEVFDNDCLHRILGCRRRDRVPCEVLCHRLDLRALPPMLLQRRLRWFGHAARRPAGEIIRGIINPVPPSHWRHKQGGQLKTWLTMLKENLARMSGIGVYGLRRWNREWLSLGVTWTHDRQAWAAAIRDVGVALDTGTTSPG